jgi:hypothetical protein
MKNITKTLLLSILFLGFSNIASAQFTGGGNSGAPAKKATSNYLYKGGYAAIGYSMPTGNFDNHASFGINLDKGRIFFFKSLENSLPQGLALGINATYISARINYLDYQSIDATGISLIVGPKVGPSVSYLIGENMAIDFYYQLNFNLGLFAASGDVYGDANGNSVFGGLLHDFGVHFRTGGLLLGLDFIIGDSKYDGTHSDVEFTDVTWNQGCINFSIGKAF